jgi:hypothetical protein
MQTLENSERFRNDYDRYKAAIEQVTNPSLKTDLEMLLSSLLREVRKIDEDHEAVFSSGRIPTGVVDSRNRITEIRKSLDSRLRDMLN